jgi:hypothetical protein
MPHHVPVREVARANLAIALTLVWAGAAACVVAACVYDVGRWVELAMTHVTQTGGPSRGFGCDRNLTGAPKKPHQIDQS